MMNLSVDFSDQLAIYSQQTFRKVLDSMARPGKINSIEPFPISGKALETTGAPYLLGLGYTLLDIEVGFHVLDRDEVFKDLARDLAFHTSSKMSPLAEADFIFLTGADDPELLTRIKCGTLDYPDTGATVIVETDYLSEESPAENGSRVKITLKGPGILGQKTLYSGLSDKFVQVLRDANMEFPLGIDLILICGNRLACIPRSTNVNF